MHAVTCIQRGRDLISMPVPRKHSSYRTAMLTWVLTISDEVSDVVDIKVE